MIIIHHCVINDFGLLNSLNFGGSLSQKQTIILIFANASSIIGVNIFFLITGYFRTSFKIKKIVSLVVQVYLIFGIVSLIGMLIGILPYSFDAIKDILNPFNKYWFLATYLGILVFSPLLNIILDNISKKESIIFIVFIILLFSLYSFKYDVFHIDGGYSLIWGIILYIIGGIIKKFNLKSKKGIIVYCTCFLINASIAVFLLLKGKIFGITSWDMYKYNNILVFIESIGLFIFFNSFANKITNNKIINVINFLASSTLMTYLLHSTCCLTVIRKIPIIFMINNGHFKLGLLLLPIYAFIIFIICSIISFLYNKTIQKIINHIFLKIENNHHYH